MDFYSALEKGNIERVREYIVSGVNLNRRKNGKAPLHIASLNYRLTIVNILIEAGANVNIMMNDGTTPLHIASQEGCLEIANVLLKNNANVNVTQNKKTELDFMAGATPLYKCREQM